VGATESIWRNRNFVAALIGGTVNDVGDWMLEIAVPVYVYTETGSGAATALVYIIDLVVGVALGPYGGSLADRWNLRTTLIGTNLLQIAALLPLFAVTADRVWPAFVVAAVQAAIAQVNNPAAFALYPRIVRPDQLVRANAFASSGGSIARLLGSSLGGILVATGGLDAVAFVDATTFLVGALGAVFIDRSVVAPLASPHDDSTERDTSVRGGIEALRSRPAVAALLGVEGVSRVAFAAFPVIFIVFVSDELAGDGTEIGLIRAMSAFGGIVAALVIARTANRFAAPNLMVVGYAAFFVVGLAFVNAPPLTDALWVYLILFALGGFPNVTSQVGQRSTMQQLCPPEVLGRLSGLSAAVGAIGAGIGAGAAALLIDHLPVRVLFNAQTTCMLVCALLGYLFVLRRLDREPDTVAPVTAYSD
jgi:predicted MFS family arabinose efflux permease